MEDREKELRVEIERLRDYLLTRDEYIKELKGKVELNIKELVRLKLPYPATWVKASPQGIKPEIYEETLSNKSAYAICSKFGRVRVDAERIEKILINFNSPYKMSLGVIENIKALAKTIAKELGGEK